MALQQVVDEQPVGGVAGAVAEHEHAAESRALGVGVHLVELHTHALAEVVGPEVVEAGALDRCGADRIDGQLGGDGLAVLDRHPLGVVQHRVGEVVDS